MKDRTWLRYNKEGEIVEIIIRDASGGKIESFKFRAADKKVQQNIAQTLRVKYGIILTGEPLKVKKDKDIDWLRYSEE